MDFLSLGSMNGSSNSGGEEEDGVSLCMGMLSHLARNGLSMLAGETKTTRPALMGLRFGGQQVTKEVVFRT